LNNLLDTNIADGYLKCIWATLTVLEVKPKSGARRRSSLFMGTNHSNRLSSCIPKIKKINP